MALTAKKPQATAESGPCADRTDGSCAMASGPSADVVIASKVHPNELPIVLSNGNQRNGYAAERLSFRGPGQLLAATYSPYALYQQLIGLASPDGGMSPAGAATAKLLLESRKSVHDLVREELLALLRHNRLSSADRQRLQLHFDSIRDAEVAMGGMGNDSVDWCDGRTLNVREIEALRDFTYDSRRVEQVGQLHLSLVALAFACNYRRAASLQWGDPYDGAIYDVPSNERGWKFSHISHRAPSDGAVGDDPLAEQAHIEIDALRMRSLAAGLEHFEARGLADHCFVMWTVNYAEALSHSPANVPHIIWGNASGYLKQGAYIDAATTNNRLHNALISAAIQDTGERVEDFGEGPSGQLEAILA